MEASAATEDIVTQHSGVFNGRRFDYRAQVSQLNVKHKDSDAASTVFTFAYVANASADQKRPVMFIFNGGPGGSSAPLHLTGLGPKRLTRTRTADLADPSVGLVDNPNSPLDAVDLVFIDPTNTGYSRTMPDTSPVAFQSVDGDSDAISQTITYWLTRNGRLDSSVYVLGESYGSLRGVALARDLARGEPKIVLAGLILSGQAITYGQGGGGLVDPYKPARYLPMMASVAWLHGRIDNVGQSWEEAVQRARQFVRSQYLGALAQGHRLDAETKARIQSTLPSLIGISEEYFRKNDTIVVEDFEAELLRDEGLVLDRYNGVESGPPPSPDVAISTEDALAGLKANIERYLTRDLKVPAKGDYWVVRSVPGWNFRPSGSRALDATLERVLKDNSTMRLMILQGRYDVLTDLGTTEYTLSQIRLPKDRLTEVLYNGGHLLPASKEVADAIRIFVGGGS